MYYPCSENKGAVTAKLICVFVFAYAKSRFSHDAARLLMRSTNGLIAMVNIEPCREKNFGVLDQV